MDVKMRKKKKNTKSPLKMLRSVLVLAALFFFQSAGAVAISNSSVPAPVGRDHDGEPETTATITDDDGGVGELKPFGIIDDGSHEDDDDDELVRVSSMRKLLAPFQLCLSCKCCVSATDPATCTTMPCCFAIDCQLPNKPYGVCAFVPKTCNCTFCAIVFGAFLYALSFHCFFSSPNQSISIHIPAKNP